MEWLKADFHLHTGDCIFDGIPHTAVQLIDKAAELGFRALAFTNHRYVIFSECWRDYALERGIILFPGVEIEIKRRHVLIVNAARDADRIRTFDDLRAYRRMNNSLIIAPHPFYPGTICLRRKLGQHRDLFDGLEYNSFYTTFFNPNEKAVRFAQDTGLPLIGGSDSHRLSMLGRTYSLIQADFDPDSILHAARQGQIKIATQPISGAEALSLAVRLRLASTRQDFKRFLFPDLLRCKYRPIRPEAAMQELSPMPTLSS
jgi:predicted metal-dependent phosphoesterase TrpH